MIRIIGINIYVIKLDKNFVNSNIRDLSKFNNKYLSIFLKVASFNYVRNDSNSNNPSNLFRS